jgi:hypothetical protein
MIDLAICEPVTKAFFTLQQIAERHPAFTERTLRHWIYNSRPRPASICGRRVLIPGNGFERVMVKIGNRIYINEPALLEWIEWSDGR